MTPGSAGGLVALEGGVDIGRLARPHREHGGVPGRLSPSSYPGFVRKSSTGHRPTTARRIGRHIAILAWASASWTPPVGWRGGRRLPALPPELYISVRVGPSNEAGGGRHDGRAMRRRAREMRSPAAPPGLRERSGFWGGLREAQRRRLRLALRGDHPGLPDPRFQKFSRSSVAQRLTAPPTVPADQRTCRSAQCYDPATS